MKLIDRYILKELCSSFVIGLSLFTFVIMMGKILKFVELLVAKGVDFFTVLRLFLYILPYSLVVTIPMAVLLATLATYGRFASDGEVVALKAAGLNLTRLMAPALALGVLAYLATSYIALAVAPNSIRAFKNLTVKLAKSRATLTLQEGVFNSPSEGVLLYVHALRGNMLQGVILIDNRDASVEQVVIAKEGRLLSDPKDLRLTLALSQGTLSTAPSNQPERYRLLRFTSYDLSLSTGQELTGALERPKGDQEMTLGELQQKILSLKKEGGNFRPFQVELQKKLAIPVACLLFVLVGTPLGIRIRKGGRGASLMLSTVFVFLYYLLIVAGEALANRGKVAPAMAMWLPNFLLSTSGAFLFLVEGWGGLSPAGWRPRQSALLSRSPALALPPQPEEQPAGEGASAGPLMPAEPVGAGVPEKVRRVPALKLRQRTGRLISADAATNIVINARGGKELTFGVEGKAVAKLAGLKLGSRVTVKYVERDGQLVARTITIPRTKKKPQSPGPKGSRRSKVKEAEEPPVTQPAPEGTGMETQLAAGLGELLEAIVAADFGGNGKKELMGWITPASFIAPRWSGNRPAHQGLQRPAHGEARENERVLAEGAGESGRTSEGADGRRGASVESKGFASGSRPPDAGGTGQKAPRVTMRILDRYIAREFSKAFLFALVALVGMYLVGDLFEKLNRFVGAQVGMRVMARYYLFSLPGIALQILPIVTLLAALLSIGNLAKHNELLAMRTGRVSTFRIVLPPLVLASAISLAALALGESVAPRTNRLAFDLYRTSVKKVPPYRLTEGHDIWYRAEGGRFLHIGLLEASSGSIRGFTTYEVGRDFQLSQRIAANRASWKDGRWSLEDGYSFLKLREDGLFTMERFSERPLDLKEKPQELTPVARKPEEMSSRELRVYIQRLRQGGIDAKQYLVDLHAKKALAFSSLVMATIGITFGLRVGRAGLLARAGACIPLGFLYWILLSVGFAFGRSGFLSPFLAAWLPNVLFSVGGISALAWVKR